MFSDFSFIYGSCVISFSCKRSVEIFLYYGPLNRSRFYVYSLDIESIQADSMYIIECTWRNVLSLFPLELFLL